MNTKIGFTFKVLKGTEPVLASYDEWSEFFANGNRQIGLAQATINGQEAMVSTVFIGIGDNLFESALFIGEECVAMQRWDTYEQAVEAHDYAVGELNAKFGLTLPYAPKQIAVDPSDA